MPIDFASTSGTRFDACLEIDSIVKTALGADPTALIIDLDPVLGVHLAAALNRRRPVAVVIVLPRWPHPEAVLPTDDLIATLIEESKRVRACESAAHVIFVLDGERSRSVRRPTTDTRIDNRYDLAVADLPDLRQLQAAGIERIVKLSPTTER